ncbi:MAG TPA: hypothetical protein DER40_01285 [Geobacter sp.]|nr:hypothetical protein [Geobacter sp.]
MPFRYYFQAGILVVPRKRSRKFFGGIFPRDQVLQEFIRLRQNARTPEIIANLLDDCTLIGDHFTVEK